jgi:hypothetical protein
MVWEMSMGQDKTNKVFAKDSNVKKNLKLGK